MTEETPKKRGRPAKAQKVPLLLKYAVWDAEGTRHEPGTTLDVDVENAKTLIAEGKAVRNDPFPGEK